MNAFILLREEEQAAFTEERRAVVRRRVERELRTAEFVAGMFEMFGPVFADTLSVLGGSEEKPLLSEEDETPDTH